MTLQQCQRRTTSTEFVEWQVRLEAERNDFKPEFHYLAQIALEVHRVLMKNPREVTLQDFLLEFETKGAPIVPKAPEVVSEEEYEKRKAERTKQSKGFWATVLGTVFPTGSQQ